MSNKNKSLDWQQQWDCQAKGGIGKDWEGPLNSDREY